MVGCGLLSMGVAIQGELDSMPLLKAYNFSHQATNICEAVVISLIKNVTKLDLVC